MGLKGDTGIMEENGTNGSNGAKGNTGDTGYRGDRGPVGNQGPIGNNGLDPCTFRLAASSDNMSVSIDRFVSGTLILFNWRKLLQLRYNAITDECDQTIVGGIDLFALINARASSQSLTDNLTLYTPTSTIYTRTYFDSLASTLNVYINANVSTTTLTTALAHYAKLTDTMHNTTGLTYSSIKNMAGADVAVFWNNATKDVELKVRCTVYNVLSVLGKVVLGNRFTVSADGYSGSIRCVPLIDTSESSLTFYKYTDMRFGAADDMWPMGQNAWFTGGYSIGTPV